MTCPPVPARKAELDWLGMPKRGRFLRRLKTGMSKANGKPCVQPEGQVRANSFSDNSPASAKNVGRSYVRWIATDSETTCACCASRHGQIFHAEKLVFPPHEGCRCVVAPVPTEAVREKDQGLRKILADTDYWEDSIKSLWDSRARDQGKDISQVSGELRKLLMMPTPRELEANPAAIKSLRPSISLWPQV